MSYVLLPIAAFGASLLTFFSGFGLGTILTPLFAIFFSIDLAIAMTAIVHLLNNLFKLFLVGGFADLKVVFRFGLPALISAFAGAALLSTLSHFPPVLVYEFMGRSFSVLWIKFIVSILMILFTFFEVLPALKNLSFHQKYLPLGGVLSGFFGGLSGHQGALRSAFLSRSGLSKESFIASGVFIACLIDFARLSVYSTPLSSNLVKGELPLLFVTTLSAFLGAHLGNQYLKKITMAGVQGIVASMLLLLSLLLAAGLI